MAKTAESVLQDARKNNEPVLVLRAKDSLAIDGLNAYYLSCVRSGCSKEHVDGLRQINKDFENWRENNLHKMKIPD